MTPDEEHRFEGAGLQPRRQDLSSEGASAPEGLDPEQQRKSSLRQREALEHRGQLRALLVLALIVLLAGFFRAGLARVFVHNWWRP